MQREYGKKILINSCFIKYRFFKCVMAPYCQSRFSLISLKNFSASKWVSVTGRWSVCLWNMTCIGHKVDKGIKVTKYHLYEVWTACIVYEHVFHVVLSCHEQILDCLGIEWQPQKLMIIHCTSSSKHLWKKIWAILVHAHSFGVSMWAGTHHMQLQKVSSYMCREKC